MKNKGEMKMKNVLIFIAGTVTGAGLVCCAYDSLMRNNETIYEDDTIKIIQGKTINGKPSAVAQVLYKE